MNLNDLHTIMQNSILRFQPLIQPYLCSPPKGSIDDRVAIYTNGFYCRLEEVLTNDYSTLALLMGEDKFNHMSQEYIQKYPSHNYSLDVLGQHLSQFIMESSPYNKKPYFAEVAAFEWAEGQAITAADATLLSVSDLQSLPPEKWPEHKFYLHPSCQIIPMQWNSLAIIEASRNNNPVPRPRKLKNPHSVVVWRRQLDIRYCKLKPSELTMLNAIQNQASFMEICEDLCQVMLEHKVANYVVQELHAWLHEQVLIKL